MSKKKKKMVMAEEQVRPVLTVRGREKLIGYCVSFSKVMLWYLVLVIISVAVGKSGEYDLSKCTLQGFSLCFLLVPAYLPLLLLSLLGIDIGFDGREAWLLGGCDAALAAAVWGWTIWYTWRRVNLSLMRTVRIFVLIMVVWGMAQLLLTGGIWVWQKGGYRGLHRHLQSEKIQK